MILKLLDLQQLLDLQDKVMTKKFLICQEKIIYPNIKLSALFLGIVLAYTFLWYLLLLTMTSCPLILFSSSLQMYLVCLAWPSRYLPLTYKTLLFPCCILSTCSLSSVFYLVEHSEVISLLFCFPPLSEHGTASFIFLNVELDCHWGTEQTNILYL